MIRLAAMAVLAVVFFVRHVGAEGATDPDKREPMVQTLITREEIADVLLRGHVAELATVPSASRLAMAWAQVALENGNGRYSYNHNLGNVGPWTPLQPWYLSRLDRNFYRSFASFDEAAAAYWHVIRKCPAAVQEFDAGDAAGAAKDLRSCGYFGADLAAYTKAMGSLYWTGRPMAVAALERWRTAHPPDPETTTDEWMDDD